MIQPISLGESTGWGRSPMAPAAGLDQWELRLVAYPYP